MVCPLLRKWELLGVLHILPPLFPSVPWNGGTPHPVTRPQPEATTLCSLLLEPSFSSRSRWTNVSPSHWASVSSISEVFIAFGQRPAARCIRLLVQSSELEGISELGSSCIAEVVLTRTRKLWGLGPHFPEAAGASCQACSPDVWKVLIILNVKFPLGFPSSSVVKNPPAVQEKRHRFNLLVGKIPWRREWLPTLVFLPGDSHGQKSLVGYSPQDCKEFDMTEYAHTHTIPFWPSGYTDKDDRRAPTYIHKEETDVMWE